MYLPSSILLNSIFLPFFSDKILNVKDLGNFDINVDSNGVSSIIDLGSEHPFIDLTRYDTETKDWFWYSDKDFPLRIQKDQIGWNVAPLWNIDPYYSHKLYFNPDSLFYSNDGKELGFYSNVTQIDTNPITLPIFTGRPIIVTVNNNTLTDFSVYDSSILPTLDNNLTEQEFYYDIDSNYIYTNLDLTLIDSTQVKVYYYTLPLELSVIAQMSNNGNKDITPIIQYYNLKLQGQNIKG